MWGSVLGGLMGITIGGVLAFCIGYFLAKRRNER